ncbi:BlaI/MecI/CopY family transcriptional regulator [Rhodococcus globerulus]|uniref:BlaI/MecI/CopY family transcriptional regulator n=1 Tax=Rhodococcus globerulus TaxID=33008 RepID=UPI0030163889
MKRLGGLESEVMNLLWDADEPLAVRDLVDRLEGGAPKAYTTILTVVTHLHEKGWVQREKRSRAYIYSPSRSRDEATSLAMRELLDNSSDSVSALLHFAQNVSEDEYEALRRALDQGKVR